MVVTAHKKPKLPSDRRLKESLKSSEAIFIAGSLSQIYRWVQCLVVYLFPIVNVTSPSIVNIQEFKRINEIRVEKQMMNMFSDVGDTLLSLAKDSGKK